MEGHLLLLLLLLLVMATTLVAFDIPEGCMVQKNGSIFHVMYDSVEFEAYVPPKFLLPPDSSQVPDTVGSAKSKPASSNNKQSRHLFSALMQCDLDDDFDFLSVKSNSVELKRTRRHSVNKSFYESEVGELAGGWEQFSLGLVGEYKLTDGQGNSWLPPNITIDCPLTHMTVQEGMLTRHCLSWTPTWKVTGPKNIVFPLNVCNQDSESRQIVSLFSKANFTPTFITGRSKIVLGWRDGNMLSTEHLDPLPPSMWHSLLFLTKISGSSIILTVMAGDEKLYEDKLDDYNNYLQVHGRAGDTFFLVHKLKDNATYVVMPAQVSHPG
nr:uncharacterized protein LOC128705845 [Cherax quadricarinatus]